MAESSVEMRVSIVALADKFIRGIKRAAEVGKDIGTALQGAADKGTAALERIGDKATEIGGKLKGLGTTLSAAGASVVGPLALMGKEAAEFGAGMSTVATLGVEGTQRLGDGLQDLREQYGETTKLTGELYDTISAGVGPDGALSVMEAAAKGAVAGNGELASALDATTSAMNSYGKGADEAESVVGMFATAVKHGKTTIDALGGSFARAAPMAAQVGVELDELLAATAAVTTTGAPASEVFSGLKATIVSIAKPSQTAADKMGSLGIEYGTAAIKADGLVGWLRKAKAAMDEAGYSAEEQSQAFTTMLGSTEAMNIAFALTSDTIGAKFDAALGDMAHSVDNLNAAFEAGQANDPTLTWRQLAASLSTLAEDIGAVVLPAVAPLVESARDMAQEVRAWVNENPALTATLVGVAAAVGGLLTVVGPFVFALGMMATGIGSIAGAATLATGALSLMGKAMVAATGPVGIIVALFAGLAAAIYLNWDEIKQVTVATLNFLWGFIKGVAGGIWDIIRTPFDLAKALFQVVTGDFSGAADTVLGIAERLHDRVMGWLGGIGDAIAATFQTAKDLWEYVTGTADDGSLKGDGVRGQVLSRAKALRKAGRGDEAAALLAEAGGGARIPALASGGIVTRPTVALVGEAGPEAVVPLNRSGGAIGGNITVNISGAADPEATARAVVSHLKRRRGF